MRLLGCGLILGAMIITWGCEPSTPGGGQATLVNMVPASLSGETNQDSEPFLAIHPGNARLMAASAFTPNPGGPFSTTAPIYISQDGGGTWTLHNTVPSNSITGDITHSFGAGGGRLFAGILRRPGSLLLTELMTPNFLSPATMTVQNSRNQPDQPFVRATTGGANARVYVGNNDLGVLPNTATIDFSANSGNTYNSLRIAFRGCSPQCGPSVRPAFAGDGTAYAAYLGWQSFSGGVATSDVVVVRDDNGGVGANPFRDLQGTDGQPGRRVVQGVSIPWSNAPTLGQERIGSTLSIAVDPNNSGIVYVAWADRVGNGDIYTIHVRRSTDRGVTWSGDVRSVRNATNPALAVAENGTVGMLYQQVTGSGTNRRWVTHIVQTRDGFTTVQDTILATVPANTPAPQFLPYIGDYNFLLAVGNEFRGIFSANNTPAMANFPQGVTYQRNANFNTQTLLDGSGNPVAVSIDPFYFSVAAIS